MKFLNIIFFVEKTRVFRNLIQQYGYTTIAAKPAQKQQRHLAGGSSWGKENYHHYGT
ncbi:MAG TPA: hypothetical protein VNJ07_14195 [Chitinophagales bacterium]|nr:hypothetical protein [Chitinophagales bacterium]